MGIDVVVLEIVGVVIIGGFICRLLLSGLVVVGIIVWMVVGC